MGNFLKNEVGEKFNIVFATGGTGGHLKPPQQLADILGKNHKIVFMGKKLSSNYNFRSEGYFFKEIESSPLNRKNFIKGFFLIFKGFLQSLLFFWKFKPSVVFGFGSYYSFPILLAAFFLKKPIILFEPNVSLGRVNKFFVKRARVLAHQFLKGEYINGELVQLLPWGNSMKIENKERALKKLGLEENVFTFLVFGGSQGSSFINEIFLDAAIFFKKNKIKFQVIHLFGKGEDLKKRYEKSLRGIKFFISPFERDMQKFFSAADVAICRSGALTLSELIFFSLPSILIPFELSSKDHQKENAYFMQNDIKGGVCLLEGNEKKFKGILKDFIQNKEKVRKMRENLSIFKESVKNRKTISQILYEIGEKR
jgi:UDP-N-acetylglucosamine--N-acetylmuramyl-(pentapeptide) pyrophosphoryl-undecaprenol N-acetylglucosamine transferase